RDGLRAGHGDVRVRALTSAWRGSIADRVALVTLVTLLSDLGTRDTYAGVMEGAILCVAPDVRVLHLTHGVPPGDIAGGARALADAVVHVPRGIHVAVVDP